MYIGRSAIFDIDLMYLFLNAVLIRKLIVITSEWLFFMKESFFLQESCSSMGIGKVQSYVVQVMS